MPKSAGMTEMVNLLSRIDRKVSSLEELVTEIRSEVRSRGVEAEWMTTRQVADLVGRSEFSVRQWCNQNRLRAEKTENGREWRIHRSELERYRREGLLPAGRAE